MALPFTRAGLIVLGLLFACSIRAQTGTRPGYASFFVGSGIGHGGDLGMSLEAGINQISFFGTLGHKFERTATTLDTVEGMSPDLKLVTVTIPSSWNTSFGIRYNVLNNHYYKPRFGMQVGWITNYYAREIDPLPELDYDPIVKGFSFHAGLEFEAPLLISMDAMVAPRFGIFNPEEHPHFPKMYVGFSLGIGLALEEILSDSFRRKRARPTKVNFNYD